MIITTEFKLLADICRALNTEWIIGDMYCTFAIDNMMNANFRYCDCNPLANYSLNYRFLVKDITLVEKEFKESKTDIVINMCNNEVISISCNNVVAFNITGLDRPHIQLLLDTKQVHISVPLLTKDLSDDEDFKIVTSLKSDDGMGFYKTDRFIMSIFYGLLKVNKGNTVDLSIYNVDEISFLSVFTVNKKKFNIVNHIKYMYTRV